MENYEKAIKLPDMQSRVGTAQENAHPMPSLQVFALERPHGREEERGRMSKLSELRIREKEIQAYVNAAREDYYRKQKEADVLRGKLDIVKEKLRDINREIISELQSSVVAQ